MRQAKKNLSLALALAFTFSTFSAYADVQLAESKIDPASVPGVKAEDAQKNHDAKLGLVEKLNIPTGSHMCAEGSVDCSDVVIVKPLPIEPTKPPVCPVPDGPVIILPLPPVEGFIPLPEGKPVTPVCGPNMFCPEAPGKKPEPPIVKSHTVKIPADSAHPYDTYYSVNKNNLTLTFTPPDGFGQTTTYVLDKATGVLTIYTSYTYDPTKPRTMNYIPNTAIVYLPGSVEYAAAMGEMIKNAEANASRAERRNQLFIAGFVAKLKKIAARPIKLPLPLIPNYTSNSAMAVKIA